MKKSLVWTALAFGFMFGPGNTGNVYAASTVMQCDPNATGSTMYPNVACDSTGKLIMSGGGTGGSTIVSGTAASGSVPIGNPVLAAGFDGTNVRSLRVATNGSLLVNGGITAGSAVGGTGLAVAGSDGTNAQFIKTDIAGQVAVIPGNGALTDCSGTITVGGTVQSLTGTNANRRYFLFQNLSVTDLYINFTNNATIGGGSIKVPSNGSFVMENGFVSTEAISVIGATTTQAFTCKQR